MLFFELFIIHLVALFNLANWFLPHFIVPFVGNLHLFMNYNSFDF